MKPFKLQTEQCVPRPLAEVFAFFKRPENLAMITPPWLGFRIETPSPIPMKAGTEIDYRIRVLGIPLRWRSRITVWEPQRVFVDEQLAGPYALWRHEHTFTETEGGTLVKDAVVYALPFGPAGRIIHALIVRRQLRAIFAFRKKAIERILGPSVLTNSQKAAQ